MTSGSLFGGWLIDELGYGYHSTLTYTTLLLLLKLFSFPTDNSESMVLNIPSYPLCTQVSNLELKYKETFCFLTPSLLLSTTVSYGPRVGGGGSCCLSHLVHFASRKAFPPFRLPPVLFLHFLRRFNRFRILYYIFLNNICLSRSWWW